MFSTIGTSFCSLISYSFYRDSKRELDLIESATPLTPDSQYGMRYITGFIKGKRLVQHNNKSFITLEEESYNVIERIMMSLRGAQTKEELIFIGSKVELGDIEIASPHGTSLNINNLLAHFHLSYAKKIDDIFVPTKTHQELVNTEINLSSTSVKVKNSRLTGILFKYSGVEYNPNTLYTIIGKTNGKEFFGRCAIKENMSIEDIRGELENSVSFLKRLTIGIICTGILTGCAEVYWGRR